MFISRISKSEIVNGRCQQRPKMGAVGVVPNRNVPCQTNMRICSKIESNNPMATKIIEVWLSSHILIEVI